jgi:hypothetical protein
MPPSQAGCWTEVDKTPGQENGTRIVKSDAIPGVSKVEPFLEARSLGASGRVDGDMQTTIFGGATTRGPSRSLVQLAFSNRLAAGGRWCFSTSP